MHLLISNPVKRRDQNGAVLIVGLLILLLTTMIAVTSMQNANLQEKMASNSQERNKAFQAAASASDSTFNNMWGDNLNWLMTAAINQDLAGTDNWPTTNFSVDDPTITTEVSLVTMGAETLECLSSAGINAEEGNADIKCYRFQLGSTAETQGSGAVVTITQGFYTK